MEFRTVEGAEIARAMMNAWLQKNKHRIQYQEIFVNNAYAIEYRKLSLLDNAVVLITLFLFPANKREQP
jgi:hypothetical protein